MEEPKVDPVIVAKLMRGERPDDMSYEDFRIKRKMIQKFLKQKNKGYLYKKN